MAESTKKTLLRRIADTLSLNYVKEEPVKNTPEDKKLTSTFVKDHIYRTRQDIQKWRTALNYAEDPDQPYRVPLYKIYNEVVLDTNITALLELKKDRIKSMDFMMVDEKGEQNDEYTDFFNQQWFLDLLDEIIDSKFWGYSLIQIDSIDAKNRLGLELVDRNYIIPERKEYKKSYYDFWGTSYDSPEYLEYLLEIGDQYDLGLFNQLAPIYLWKKSALQGWAEFQEGFGNPIVIGKSNSYKPEERAKMETFLANLGSRGYAVIDSDTMIEFQETTNIDAYNLFEHMITYLDNEIAKLILGATMTTENGSSRSQAEVHERQSDLKTMADLKNIEFYINDYIIPKLVDLGISIPEDIKFKYDKEPKLSLNEQVTTDLKLLDYYDIDPQYFINKYGIPVEKKINPINDEDTNNETTE